MQKHETNLVRKDFDNLLKKIYDTFQTNDKKQKKKYLNPNAKAFMHKFLKKIK